MRLIDADALHKSLEEVYEHPDSMLRDSAWWFFGRLEDATTVDASSIVRCKDCIHYGDVGDCEVHPYDGRFNVNYFCADGEKKA